MRGGAGHPRLSGIVALNDQRHGYKRRPGHDVVIGHRIEHDRIKSIHHRHGRVWPGHPWFDAWWTGLVSLNAFAMNCVGHQSPGLWRHPRDRSAEFNRLSFWTSLAKTLEAGLFDGLFLADVLGVYGGSPDAALRHGMQVLANDPSLLVPAMAAVTTNLGFGVTSNLTYEPAFPLACRMSTLDQLTEGRIGWNVLTGYLDSADRHQRNARIR